MELAKLTWKEAEEALKTIDTVILPVGSLENHGSHGPLGTDFMIPEYLARELASRLDVLLLPTLAYGVCPHHQGFPGTVNIGHRVLYDLVEAISLDLMEQGIRRFIFLNGHGGNDPALEAVALKIYEKGGLGAVVDWWSLAGQINPAWAGGHAGGQEASAILAIDPDLVRMDLVMDRDYRGLGEKLPASSINTVEFKGAHIKVMRKVKDVVESGWFGVDHPADASREMGQEMLDKTLAYLVEFIGEFQKVSLD